MDLQKILFPTDFSTANLAAMRWASALARDHEAEIIICHVHEPPLPPPTMPAASAGIVKPNVEPLDRQLHEVHPSDESIRHRHQLLEGAPSEQISRLAGDEDVDLIVIGTHGRTGMGRLLMGSVAEGVVRRAPCPVLSVRLDDQSKTPQQIRTILFPTDLSERSNSALAVAASMARDFGAQLLLLHVEQPSTSYLPGGETQVVMPETTFEQRKEQLEQVHPPQPEVPLSRHLLRGDPAAMIQDFAREHNVDMILMATHGRTGLSRVLMGSVTEAVVRHACCPVLTVGTIKTSHPEASTPSR